MDTKQQLKPFQYYSLSELQQMFLCNCYSSADLQIYLRSLELIYEHDCEQVENHDVGSKDHKYHARVAADMSECIEFVKKQM